MNHAKEKTSNELESTKQKVESHAKNIKVLWFRITFSFFIKKQIQLFREFFVLGNILK